MCVDRKLVEERERTDGKRVRRPPQQEASAFQQQQTMHSKQPQYHQRRERAKAACLDKKSYTTCL